MNSDKFMRKLFSIIVIIFLPVYSLFAQFNKQESKTDSTISNLDARIIDIIFKLPEVKKESENIEQESQGRRHLSIVIYKKPSKHRNFYWIKVWEDNGISYTTHFNFYVYQKSLEIKYYDPAVDTIIDLKVWRNNRS